MKSQNSFAQFVTRVYRCKMSFKFPFIQKEVHAIFHVVLHCVRWKTNPLDIMQ